MKEKNNGSVPARGEIDSRYQWDLTAVYATEDRWEEDCRRLEQMLADMAGYRGKLGKSATYLLQALRQRDQLQLLSGQIALYAYLKRDENMHYNRAVAMADEALSLETRVKSALSFFEPELAALDEAVIRQWVESNQQLKQYAHYLDNLFRRKPHILLPAAEELMAQAGEIAAAPYNIFSILCEADICFPCITDGTGKAVELSQGRYRQFLQSASREVRRQAFTSLNTTFSQYKNTLATSLGCQVKAAVFNARVRHFDGALQAALFEDNLPLAVYENVVNTVEANLAPFHRYMALKQRALGLKQIHMYDLYAPLVRDVQFSFPYNRAREIVLTALKPLGGLYSRRLEEGFYGGWIDVYENRGKRSGAYSWGTYTTHPYVLLNYNCSLYSLFTLAHELGHSLHSYYSNREQAPVNADYSIFNAEVASILNEALLNAYLLKNIEDKEKRLYIINHYLERVRLMVYRQAMFAWFEREIYCRHEAGAAMTGKDYSRLWLKLNRRWHGPAMHVDQEIAIEWARIPHFYYNFYVFKYVTGFAAATSIARKILAGEVPVRDRYLQFLAAGGSDYPLNLLMKAGVDMTSPRPLQDTLNQFAGLVAELDSLL